ncbi:hypothetical protein Ancab_034292 [Ancistrocladus abbreviatus]
MKLVHKVSRCGLVGWLIADEIVKSYIVKGVINKAWKLLNKVVRDAIHKSGSDEDAVTRVIVTRAERDLEEIKEIYYKRNSVALDVAVAKETSGHYKSFLLTLLGKGDL